MKTRIATLLFLAGLFISTTAFSNQPTPATAAANESVVNALCKELTYPQFAIDDQLECSVVVSILIQEDGSIDVDCANCVCPRMKAHVINDVEDLGGRYFKRFAGQNVKVKIKYKLIS